MTGDRIVRVPGDFTYELPYNDDYGSIRLSSPWTREAIRLKVWQRTHAARTILAVIDGNRVICAGPITDRSLSTDGYTLNAAASIWRALEDRLVLNPALATSFADGEVLIDEDNPAPQWYSQTTGSYRDIAADLVALAQTWGPLPITLPEREGGVHVRTYNGWELHTVASRLALLTNVITAPELRFVPSLRPDGGITFTLEGAPELIARVHRWDTTLPRQGVAFTRITEDSALLASDVWAFGGGSEDIVLAARSTTPALTELGWPVMQMALTNQSSISNLPALKAHTDERAARGTTTPEVYEFRVQRAHAPQPGDWANIRLRHPAYGMQEVPLKVLFVSGNSGDWLTVKGRPRNGL
ncbi:hypothetical protein J2Y69_003347 [Microbacterium resistens]|uniref:Minor tail protein n=1 Tax=Microbacterium resistens TaxID=156977 RepID=A0ABU1SGJ4_9MICO|nr:hypothetical protein [Microbacterium resistens]MDR6868723.1 hypothetical protein [Microbacterium resistens]